MSKLTIRVNVEQFKELEKDLRGSNGRFARVAHEELKKFADEAIRMLKEDVWRNEYNLPPKRRDNGKPPLIDSEKYINSYQAEVKGLEAHVGPTGMNDHMSNEELAEVLEHGLQGENGFPARPHLRPWGMKVEKKLAKLGERIAHGLFGNR